MKQNRKVRRVDGHATHHRISPHSVKISGFLLKLLYAVAYVGGCCHPPLADSAFACRRSRATLRPGVWKRSCPASRRFARPSTEQVNYSKKPLQIARAGFRNIRAESRRLIWFVARYHIGHSPCNSYNWDSSILNCETTVSNRTAGFTRKYSCVRTFHIPTISCHGISGCASLISSDILAAASPR